MKLLLKIFGGLLFFSCIQNVSANVQDSIHIDTTSSRYKLWKAIEIDTIPYHISHENISKQAQSSALRLMFASGQDTSGVKNLYLRAYYDNLLAQEDNLLDIYETNLNEHPEFVVDFYGHYGLRRVLSCYNNPSDSCRSIFTWGLSFIEKAAESSVVMPKEQWKWLYNRLSKKMPYDNFDQKINFLNQPEIFNQKNWEGAIISFHRKPNTKNLLVSNGSRFPLQVLEWQDSTSNWIDVTTITGLDSFPGGYRLYAGDLNQDGYEDMIILRSASTRMSPAKLFPSVLINQKDGTFKDIALELELNKISKPQCACVADVNKDGLLDMFFGNLRDQSMFFIQNADGTFTDKRNSFGMNEFRDNIQDCIFIDINGDGNTDLLLSEFHESNKVYIQSYTQNQRLYFDNQTKEYDLYTPNFGGALLSIPNSKNEALFLSDISQRYEILPNILNKIDSIQKDTSFYIYNTEDQVIKDILPKELSTYRTGIWINTLNQPILLYSGGINTEVILPYFEYTLGDENVKVAYDERLPIYTHSTTVIEIDQQPVIIFRGGADYPAMKSGTVLVSYRPDENGTYHKIFDIQKAYIGQQIDFSIEDQVGNLTHKRIYVQLRDSKGNNAMQEWIWLPEGYKIIVHTKMESIENSGNKTKKRKKKK